MPLGLQPTLCIHTVSINRKKRHPNPASRQPPTLSDQRRRFLRNKQYSLQTEQVYVSWARWYTRFHILRHPSDMGALEILIQRPTGLGG